MKVNDYCYIKNNRKYGIGKVYSMLENNNVLVSFKTFMKMFSIGNVISSSNPIDLIEVGDYVNGSPVCLIKSDDNDKLWVYTDSNYKYGYTQEDIKSIVTKEMFEEMQYKVGEQ